MSTIYDVVIIGGGPAGLTAAIYAARGNLSLLVVEGYFPGGQLMYTTDVENFPGFPEGIMGPDLMMRMRQQAERFGATFLTKDVDKVDFSEVIKKIYVDGEELKAKTVIISTGAKARMLGVEREEEMIGKGVSTCATCDGAFFREKQVGIVGGGDSAMEEAIFLTRFAKEVHVIHRRDSLRASKIMQDKAMANEKITFHWNREVTELQGESKLTGVTMSSTVNESTEHLELDGLFIAIGHVPNTKIVEGLMDFDDLKYIQTTRGTPVTNVEGVFACGDVQDHRYRQAITAAGSGCQAALEAEKYLEHVG